MGAESPRWLFGALPWIIFILLKTAMCRDMFDRVCRKCFPETAPGNFTWNTGNGTRWVNDGIYEYQWDFEITATLPFLLKCPGYYSVRANQGAESGELEWRWPFYGKRWQSCQNDVKPIWISCSWWKDCLSRSKLLRCIVFIAEAIVAPVEVTKYFGDDAVIAKGMWNCL